MNRNGFAGQGGGRRPDAPIRPLDLSGRERQLRAAMVAMERIATSFARAARRSLPFLVRHHGRIVPTQVQIAPMVTDASSFPTGPTYSVRVGTPDTLAWATLTLNADAVALTLEGSLGGAAGQIPVALTASELTPAQRALLLRVGRSLALDVATAIREEVGLAMTVLPADAPAPQGQSADALEIICQIEGLQAPASLVLSASAEALEAAAREHTQPGEMAQGDPRLVEAMREVPLEVVAELGRISVGLKKILSFRVGDVLRLTTATDDPVSVRVSGVEKFLGMPVLSRGQLAIEIRSRHER